MTVAEEFVLGDGVGRPEITNSVLKADAELMVENTAERLEFEVGVGPPEMMPPVLNAIAELTTEITME
jgi:hypothetical protein